MRLGWSQQMEKAAAISLFDIPASGTEDSLQKLAWEAMGYGGASVKVQCKKVRRGLGWASSRVVRPIGSIRLKMDCPHRLPQGS